ncbi:MAG TPA: SprT-like domain-containing protein, partial [Edaphocola sp.]|nr:SprT-like domain-containing protein [Edaphocola sp.]
MEAKSEKPSPNVNRTFSESILKLFNESKTVNLTIANGDLEGTNGTTFKTSITISDTYLKNATQLSIARTMIHEMTHAYINALFHNRKEFNSMDFHQKLAEYA